jgi:tetratricopeptide (TPR) repeat protein
MQAQDLFEQALAARPDHAAAHLALAELLAPYALLAPGGRDDESRAGPVVTVDRVLRAYGGAVQADPADTTAVNGLIDFALKAGRNQEAAEGFRELTRRDRENPEVLIRFGDFLAGPGENPEEALGVYSQALIWRPDDQATHAKIADLHIDAALAHLELDQYVAVEAELREARKHVRGKDSPQARRLRDAERALAHASGRR